MTRTNLVVNSEKAPKADKAAGASGAKISGLVDHKSLRLRVGVIKATKTRSTDRGVWV